MALTNTKGGCYPLLGFGGCNWGPDRPAWPLTEWDPGEAWQTAHHTHTHPPVTGFGLILDRVKLDKRKPIICLGNRYTSPLPGFRVYEVPEGQGETTRSSGGKSNILIQAIDQKPWETLARQTECDGGCDAGQGNTGEGLVHRQRGRLD